jgi:hypothetical protein
MSVQVSLHPHLYSINHPIITFFSSWTFHIDSIYVIIFFEIVKALSLLSILIVGFVLTYYILRPFTRVLEFKLSKCSWSFNSGSSSFVSDCSACNDNNVRWTAIWSCLHWNSWRTTFSDNRFDYTHFIRNNHGHFIDEPTHWSSD